MAKKIPQSQRRKATLPKPNRREEASFRTRIVVKFHDFIQIPYRDGIEKLLDQHGIGCWSELVKRFPGITIVRLFTSLSPEKIRDLTNRATRLDPTYKAPNLLTYFAVEVPACIDPQALVEALAAWKSVQHVYLAGIPGPPPAVIPDDDCVSQGYLDPATDGIDAEFAWASVDPGGAGEGIQFIDLEQGWALDHEDLDDAGITLISGENRDHFDHGTSTLGVVVAVDHDDNFGIVGIAPKASARVISEWRKSNPLTYNTADTILEAIAALNFGDVLLLETQHWPVGSSRPWPTEFEQAVFDMIRLGAALGIVIVEPAGNGWRDLDSYTETSGAKPFNPADSGFRDSGALMVGAATHTHPHERTGDSNFGGRINCYAWGENVYTLNTDYDGSDLDGYTPTFDGTSSASAIIAGAALIVQSVARQTLGWRLSPWQVRSVLSDRATGTLSNNEAVDKIGVMPNLRNIIQDVLRVTPDIYIRDFVGDTGAPHSGSISDSPDIILQAAQVPNPQLAFGEGSGTENSDAIGNTIEIGHDNYIYVRVRNRSGADATNVSATIYQAPVATLITPEMLAPIGTVTIPFVPSGDVLTVSDAITWPQSSLPPLGQSSFVCLVGNALDPTPDFADFRNWDNYLRFIRNNNNVTVRNVQFVSPAPARTRSTAPANDFELSFLATGPFDQARPMQLEFAGKLPAGSRLVLEAPRYFLIAAQEHSPNLELDKKKRVSLLPLNPYGQRLLREILFPAKARIPLKLRVQIPRERLKSSYEVFVRQLYQNEEVGRVTWRLGSRAEAR